MLNECVTRKTRNRKARCSTEHNTKGFSILEDCSFAHLNQTLTADFVQCVKELNLFYFLEGPKINNDKPFYIIGITRGSRMSDYKIYYAGKNVRVLRMIRFRDRETTSYSKDFRTPLQRFETLVKQELKAEKQNLPGRGTEIFKSFDKVQKVIDEVLKKNKYEKKTFKTPQRPQRGYRRPKKGDIVVYYWKTRDTDKKYTLKIQSINYNNAIVEKKKGWRLQDRMLNFPKKKFKGVGKKLTKDGDWRFEKTTSEE